MRRPFLFARLALAPFAPTQEGRRGRRENSVSHGRLCKEKSTDEGRHRESRKFSRRPAQRARGLCFANAASGTRVPFAPLRTMVSTACFARPPEDVPSYPPLAGLLDFAVLALARVPDEAAKKGPVASGRLAGTVRLQPLRARVRYAHRPQPPFPIRTSNTPRDMALYLDRDEKEYSPSLGWKYGGGGKIKVLPSVLLLAAKMVGEAIAQTYESPICPIVVISCVYIPFWLIVVDEMLTHSYRPKPLQLAPNIISNHAQLDETFSPGRE